MHGGTTREVPIETLGESFSRYRVCLPRALEVMQSSLERYGQLSPVIVLERERGLELIDGFKRIEAARRLELATLSACVVDWDEQSAKAAIYLLNRVGGRTTDVEEAWIVHALVREDELSQTEVAELLGKHKSWVSRRLALIERLCSEAREDLQLGLLTPTAAREILRLPNGNQAEVLEATRREGLSSSQTRVLVDAFLSCPTRTEQEFVLTKPREAISQEEGCGRPGYDPRLSGAGNRVARRLGLLFDLLSRMESWLRIQGRAELTVSDLSVLEPEVKKLSAQCHAVAEAAEDFSWSPAAIRAGDERATP